MAVKRSFFNLNYYEVLEVRYEATKSEIKKSYFRLVKKYHPDVSKDKNAILKFKRLNEAYETLIDNEKREKYDSYLNGYFDMIII